MGVGIGGEYPLSSSDTADSTSDSQHSGRNVSCLCARQARNGFMSSGWLPPRVFSVARKRDMETPFRRWWTHLSPWPHQPSPDSSERQELRSCCLPAKGLGANNASNYFKVL